LSRKLRVAPYSAAKASTLQWGRDQLVAEIQVHELKLALALYASMGPRPIGRGNAIPTVRNNPGDLASMGPRPIGRGNCRWLQASAARGRASMGPRPIGRGNAGCTR